VGAETGNRKNKVIPEEEWINYLCGRCYLNEIPFFMKNSLAYMKGELIQEFPKITEVK
jgi:hypothetical protein